MATSPTVRIRRHATGTSVGAPTLLNAELAFDENGIILYYGTGISSGVIAAQTIAIGGSGAFVSLAGSQTISGAKTLTGGVDMSGSSQGTVKSVTPATASNTTDVATTAWVRTFGQASNAYLNAIGAIAAVGLVAITLTGGSPTAAAVAITGTASNITVANGNGVGGNPTINLATVTVSGTGAKPTVDAYGRVTGLGALAGSDISGGGGVLVNGTTAFTAAQGGVSPSAKYDNTNTLVTSAWVHATGLGLTPTLFTYTTTTSIPANNGGALTTYTGTAAATFTLPAANGSGLAGNVYVISNESSYPLTITRAGSDTTTEGSSFTMNPGERIGLMTDNVSAWHAIWRSSYGTGTFSGNVTIGGTLAVTGNTTLSGSVTMPVPNLPSQSASTFLASPTGAAGAPTFRGIVATDLPVATTGALGVVIVGTGLSVTAGTVSANVQSVATLTGAITAAALAGQLTLLATLASPTFTGLPLAPTAANGTNTTQIATTAFVLATRHDQLAAPTNAVSWNSQALTNLLDPVNPQDAATKNYVDASRAGLQVKTPVRVVATANITIATPGTAIDGVTLAANDRVLLTAQTTASQNGIYVFNGSASAMTRAVDANGVNNDQSGQGYGTISEGMFVFVGEGTAWKSTGWVLQTAGSSATGGITVGTTSLTFVQFSGTGDLTFGNGFTVTGNAIAMNVSASFTFTGGALTIASLPSGVQTSITQLGTITTGIWNGTAITAAYGGLGNISAATGFILLASGVPSFVTAISPATQITYNSGAAPITAASAFASGLGDMAGQLSNAVAITGGTIQGVTLDCGTF